MIVLRIIETATWILNEDWAFVCTHDCGSHVETVEVPTMRNGEYDTYEQRIYVCDDCDADVDGNPDLDRAEMLAEMQADEARGK